MFPDPQTFQGQLELLLPHIHCVYPGPDCSIENFSMLTVFDQYAQLLPVKYVSHCMEYPQQNNAEDSIASVWDLSIAFFL